jgi:murein DD-endopeptidase MepM/ murein hydrolase activator NlpD
VRLTRRLTLAGLISAPAFPAIAAPPPLSFSGPFVQGAAVIGRTAPGADYSIDGEVRGQASEHGLFVIGFDRDAPAQARIVVRDSGGVGERTVDVAPGDYEIQRIDGLPQQTVTPQGEELLAKIAAEAERKQVGFASQAQGDWFSSGFISPLENYRLSGRFGGQRVLNGVPDRPHYGADMAAPIGTEIRAPGAGVVSFAETGLHYEGGLVMIDHGQGLISAYLHMSRVDVEKGQVLAQSQRIGAVGAEGRATGPHLCWRMKWRGRNLNPMLFVGVSAPGTSS